MCVYLFQLETLGLIILMIIWRRSVWYIDMQVYKSRLYFTALLKNWVKNIKAVCEIIKNISWFG